MHHAMVSHQLEFGTQAFDMFNM